VRSRATVAALSACLSACSGHYYKVTDQSNGLDYYTQDVEYARSGALQFKDARSGKTTVLWRWQVLEIEEGAYRKGLVSTARAR